MKEETSTNVLKRDKASAVGAMPEGVLTDAALQNVPLSDEMLEQQLSGEGMQYEEVLNEALLNEALLSEELLEDDDCLINSAGFEHDGEILQTAALQQNQGLVERNHLVTAEQAGMRFDKVAADSFSAFSRVQIQDWIKTGAMRLNGQEYKPKERVKAGDELTLKTTLEAHSEDLPENLPLDICYEDDEVLVINKAVGMVVHPGAGNRTGTLVNALLYHYPELAHLPRAGLVHRIDKDTSGLLMIAKSKSAQLHLQAQLLDKSLYRQYQCVVAGRASDIISHAVIDAPIGRHPTWRTKMAVTTNAAHGREAVTLIRGAKLLCENYSLVDIALQTGRTHQIRVHMSHLGFPLVGDALYGQRQVLRTGLTTNQRDAVQRFGRQALHAYQLGFIHPTSEEPISVTAPLPEDMCQLIAVLSHTD